MRNGLVINIRALNSIRAKILGFSAPPGSSSRLPEDPTHTGAGWGASVYRTNKNENRKEKNEISKNKTIAQEAMENLEARKRELAVKHMEDLLFNIAKNEAELEKLKASIPLINSGTYSNVYIGGTSHAHGISGYCSS